MPATADFVHQTSTTAGTGAQTLVAVLGKRSFLSAFGTGGTNVFDYFIMHRTAAEYERGLGHESGGTLVRDTVLANHLGTTALVNFTAGTKDITNDQPANQRREKLIADRIYYVRATGGSDNNDGLTLATGWSTIQKAFQTIAGTIDLGNFNITIQLADGTYTAAGGSWINGPWVGNGTVTLSGNSTTPANVIVTSSSAQWTLWVGKGGRLQVSYFEIRAPASCHGLSSDSGASVTVVGNGFRFGTVGGDQMTAGTGGTLIVNGNYSIVGNAASGAHMSCYGGLIGCSGLSITVSGGLTFGNFAISSRGGNLSAFSNSYSTTTATGARYYCDSNSLIFTNLAGETYFPGNAAGALGSGAVYT